MGAQAVRVFGAEWESLIAFLLTLAILYFSEIIPKTIGATFWKQLALPSALIIRILIKILYPFVWVSAQLTRTFSHSDASSFSDGTLDDLAERDAELVSLGVGVCRRSEANKAFDVRQFLVEFVGKEKAREVMKDYKNTVVRHHSGTYRRALISGDQGLRCIDSCGMERVPQKP